MSEDLSHIPPENLCLCLKVAEDECDSLRRILAWCGTRLSDTDRRELARMVRAKVTKDGREEDREDLRDCQALCLRMANHMAVVVQARFIKNIPLDWYAVADDMINRANEFEPRSKEATLAELRNMEEITKAVFK